MNETVLLSNIGSTAVITLNRPEKLNAWDTPMRKALAEMLGEVNASSEFRSVVITGSGRSAPVKIWMRPCIFHRATRVKTGF